MGGTHERTRIAKSAESAVVRGLPVALLSLALPACGGGGAALRRPDLAELWRECERLPAAPAVASHAHVYTCTFEGARYELPEPGTEDVVDVDVSHIPYHDVAYDRRDTYVVVRGLEPEDHVAAGVIAPERAGIGEAAMMLFGLVGGGGPDGRGPAVDMTERGPVAAPGELPFAARTEHFALAPGLMGVLSVRHDGAEHVLRVVSQSRVDFLMGASLSLDFNVLPDSPFGSVTLGDVIPGGTARALVFSQSPIYAVSGHALLGIRISDTGIWVGTPFISTTGNPLSGIELHVGQRFRELSQAMYFGVYGALRWGNRPRIIGFTGDDNLEHLPTDLLYTFTFGVEIQFDLLAIAGGRDALITAN